MIQQLIGTIVSGLTVADSNPAVAPTYIHGWKTQLNLRLDEVQNEIVWLLPVTSNSKIVGNAMIDRYNIVMGFFAKSQLEWTADQHLPIIDRQRVQCAKFIKAAKNSDLFSEVSDFIISDEYNVFDVCLSGVTLQCKITPLNGPSVC